MPPPRERAVASLNLVLSEHCPKTFVWKFFSLKVQNLGLKHLFVVNLGTNLEFWALIIENLQLFVLKLQLSVPPVFLTQYITVSQSTICVWLLVCRSRRWSPRHQHQQQHLEQHLHQSRSQAEKLEWYYRFLAGSIECLCYFDITVSLM